MSEIRDHRVNMVREVIDGLRLRLHQQHAAVRMSDPGKCDHVCCREMTHEARRGHANLDEVERELVLK